MASSAFAADALRDLQRSPRQLQAKYLYDSLGSALFDAICRLPWYRITRAEADLLRRYAPEVIRAALARGSGARVIELGCGNGEKLDALLQALPPEAPTRVDLIDISPRALEASAARVSQFPQANVTTHLGTYEAGLAAVAAGSGLDAQRLVLFLGSNIGNFGPNDARALLRDIRRTAGPGGLLLLGADLVKPESDLILAYDDPLGVTAAFNKNLLVRVNQELEADFDLGSFEHRAIWNAPARRVEMHLVSQRAQAVRLRAAAVDLRFEQGDSIWTESSYKYSEEEIASLGAEAGFAASQQWIDEPSRFALTLFEAK